MAAYTRLLLGHIARAIRSIVPWHELVQPTDGTYLQIPHQTKMVVSYSMCEMEPIPLEQACAVNLAEYNKARLVSGQFAELVEELIEGMCKESAR
jgi:hypothetical protein